MGNDILAISDLTFASLDSGNSALTLNLTDVLDLSEVTNTLTNNGAAGETVTLSNTSNGASGSWSFANAGGVDTYEFTSGGDVLAKMLIDDTVRTTMI